MSEVHDLLNLYKVEMQNWYLCYNRIDNVLYYIENWYFYSFLNSALFQRRFETSVSNLFLIIAICFTPLFVVFWYYDC